jgi:hypothetical protein
MEQNFLWRKWLYKMAQNVACFGVRLAVAGTATLVSPAACGWGYCHSRERGNPFPVIARPKAMAISI